MSPRGGRPFRLRAEGVGGSSSSSTSMTSATPIFRCLPANRDLEARLFKANEDKRDAQSRLADVTKERDRLATKVKTLERDVATSRKARPPAQAA